jgi:hypothetical protein
MMNRHLIKYHSLSYTRFKHLELAVVYNNGAKALHIVMELINVFSFVIYHLFLSAFSFSFPYLLK